MQLCNACHRHVRPGAGACPFCAAVLRTTGAARLGAAFLLGALGAACAPRPQGGTETDGATSSTGGPGLTTSGSPVTEGASTGTATGPTTTAATTVATVDPPGTTTGDSSSGEMSSLSDPDTSDSGCSFYGGCPTDFGNALVCDIWAQDCPVGQKCMPISKDGDNNAESTDCSPVSPTPDAPGEPCTVEGSPLSGLDSCDATSMCVGADPETLEGTCAAFCTGSPDEPVCPAETSCVGVGPVMAVCAPTCDPLMPACAPGQVCVSNPDDAETFVCAVDVSGDGGAIFDACDFLNDCDPGHHCGSADLAVECDPRALKCCLPFCDVNMPICSGEGATCVPWFEEGMAPAGLEDLGLCAVMP